MLSRRFFIYSLFVVIVLTVVCTNAKPGVQAQTTIPTGYDLISAVNELRASFGLPALVTNAILMSIAQNHADYQASIGSATHFSADGSRPYYRALAAGYGSGVDVVISENIAVVYGEVDMHRLLYNIWSDEAHWNTMTKSTYKHIGAGVSQSGGNIYLTIDVGWIKGGNVDTSGTSSSSSQTGSSSEDDTTSDIIVPVEIATPLADGTIYHMVMPGQAMWSIAIAYKVKILEIAQLNNLSATNPVIYAGQELLVQPSYTPGGELAISSTLVSTQLEESVIQTPIQTQMPMQTPIMTNDLPVATATQTPIQNSTPAAAEDHTVRNIIIVVACGLLGLIIVTFINPKGKS